MELTSITPTTAALRALAHPTRLRMLGLLRVDGPATATTLATRLGLNTGQTSYHLRQLAQHGLVVDDAERGNGRDRWWRAAHQSTMTDAEPAEARGPRGDGRLHAGGRRDATPSSSRPPSRKRRCSRGVARGVDAQRLRRARDRGPCRQLTEKMHEIFMELHEDADDDPDAGRLRVPVPGVPAPGLARAVQDVVMTATEPPYAAHRLPRRRRDLARRHPPLDDRDPVAGADHHRVGRPDRSGRLRRAVAAGRRQGARRAADRPARRASGRDHLRPARA